MEVNDEKIRHILQFFFDQRKKATEACEKICEVYGQDSLSIHTARKWFARFRSGNFDVKDAPRTGRPPVVEIDTIVEKIHEFPHATTHDIAIELNIDQKTVWNHLHGAGFTKKLDKWVPHKLSEKNLIDRIAACNELLKQFQNKQLLKRVVTGDEKWITYDNIQRKRSWKRRSEAPETVAKPGLTIRKVMLCCWWDCKGIIHYELLQPGQTINSDLYCQQLMRLSEAIKKNRPELTKSRGVIFQQDNARPHTSLVTRQKLEELGWEVLKHPPYSPDLAPSDYHLFQSLSNSLRGKKLNSKSDCENHLTAFFGQKPGKFWEDGIMALPGRWRMTIDTNGQYLD